MKKNYFFAVFLLLFLILISRTFFSSISPAFFDGPEYLKLFQNSSFLDSLKSVHYPIHPLFLAIGFLSGRIPVGETLFRIEFLNAIIGFLSIIVLYRLFREFFKEDKALFLIAFAALTPFFWLSQINIMYEPLLGLFLIGSFYFLVRWTKEKKVRFLHFSAVSFALSFLVSSTSLLYLIFFVGFLLKSGRRPLGKWLAVLTVYLLFSLGIYFFILSFRHLPLREAFSVLTSGSGLLTKIRLEGWMFFPRLVRNCLVVYLNYLTIPVGVLVTALAIGEFFLKRNRLLILSWLASFLLLNSFWHAGMYGRLSLFLTLPPLLFLSKIKSRFLLFSLVFFLLIHSCRLVLPYHFQVPPYLLEKEFLENKLKSSMLLVVSNYEEPFLCEKFSCLVLNSPKTDLPEIKKQIDFALSKKQKVFFTSQALSAPYWQYDGMNYQILSQRKNYAPTEGEKLLDNYDYLVFKEWPDWRLSLYQILGTTGIFSMGGRGLALFLIR